MWMGLSNQVEFCSHTTPLPDRTAGQRSKKRDQEIKWSEISSVHLWEWMVPHRWSQTLTPDPSEWVIVQVTACTVGAYHLNRCCWAPWGEWWRLCIDREDTCEGTGPYRLYAPRGRHRKNCRSTFYSPDRINETDNWAVILQLED